MKRTIVITGGLGLLGINLVNYLTELNYHIIVIDIVDENKVKLNCDYIEFDLMDIKNYAKLKDKIQQKTSNLKVLINNAAFNPKIEGNGSSFGKFEDQKVDELEEEIKLNLESPIFLIQSLLDLFNKKDNKNCKIINVVSTYALVSPNQDLYKPLSKFENREIIKPIGYPVTKAGLVMVTKYLASYLGRNKFNVNGIAPGGIENGQNQIFIDEYSKMTPMGRMAKADDMMGVFELLCSDKSDYINGQILTVDGGWTVW